MDDSAHDKPPPRRSGLDSRVSAVKSIISKRTRSDGPALPDVLASLRLAQAELEGFATDEKVLRVHVHALERLFPDLRFVMRLAPPNIEHAGIVQAATHHLRPESAEQVAITEAGLLRAGLTQPATAPSGMALRRTYEASLIDDNGSEAAFCDGLDVPLVIESEVVGIVAAEFDRGAQFSPRLEDALLTVAHQVGQTLESSRLRRETMHLRDYLEKLLEHANIPVLVVGRDRGIRVVSQAFERITGLRREDLGARDVLHLAGQRDRARVLSAFVSAMRGRDVDPFELRLPSARGGHARLSFTLAPILDSEGRAAGVIAIGQDRTEVRELEGQVLHAERLATLGQLAAGIVHEINNPLTSISVYGEYLLNKLKRSGTEVADLDRLERILQSSDRIMSFTRNLLTYARPSKEEAQPLDINHVVEEALGFCDHLIREARMSVTLDFGDGLPECDGVPGQLHQVFVNLITNACNAARERGGELRVTTVQVSRDRVQIRIEDDGVGIPHDDLERVFEPFFSTRRRGKGTGLGLSIVKSIVERHDGEIVLESEPGVGTKVKVTLPSRGPQKDA